MVSVLPSAAASLKSARQVCSLPPAAGHHASEASIRLISCFTRAAYTAILLATCLGRCLWAGDSWEKKPYSEWTETEALKVLQDSAWSRLTFVWVNGEARADESGVGNAAGGKAHTEQHTNCCRTFTRVVDGPSPENEPAGAAPPGDSCF